MSSLTVIDKRYLEKFLNMDGGYVLNYSDNSFGTFFHRQAVDIHGPKYQTYGTSKAKKLRAFWDTENDSVVGKVLSAMIDEYEVDCELNKKQMDKELLAKVRGIVARLSGKPQAAATPTQTANDFLNHEFTIPNIQRLPVEPLAIPIIESRLAEARIALGVC
jgi:hypothetical protein